MRSIKSNELNAYRMSVNESVFLKEKSTFTNLFIIFKKSEIKLALRYATALNLELEAADMVG